VASILFLRGVPLDRIFPAPEVAHAVEARPFHLSFRRGGNRRAADVGAAKANRGSESRTFVSAVAWRRGSNFPLLREMAETSTFSCLRFWIKKAVKISRRAGLLRAPDSGEETGGIGSRAGRLMAAGSA